MRLLFLILFTALVSFSQGQLKRLSKATKLYDEARYEKAFRHNEKVLAHKETRNNPEAYLLHAKILLALEGHPDFPKALSDALKNAEKAMRKSKDPDGMMRGDSVFFTELRGRCMDAAEAELKAGKYIQADKDFTKLYELYRYLPAKWGTARVALELKDTVMALRISREIVQMVFDSSDRLSFVPDIPETPFVLIIDHYIQEKNYDTASWYAERSADLYGNSALLDQRLLKSFLLLVTSRPPDLATLQLFARMRPRFEEDSTYIHKENVLFLYLINMYAADEEQKHISDSLLSGFIQIKSDYYLKYGADYQRKDPIYNPQHNEFIFNLIRYTARYERERMLSMLLNNYVSGRYADSAFTQLSRPDRWKNLFERTRAEYSVFLLSASLRVAGEELKKEGWFLPYKRKLLLEAMHSPGQFRDRIALYNFVPFMLNEYPRDQQVYKGMNQLSKSIIREYTDSAWFSYAKLAIKQHDLYYAQDKEVRELKKHFVVQDYLANYYGSRLLKDSVDGRSVSEFVWKGNEFLCDAGSVPEQVQDKVEQRINYFRRAAGVPDYVTLDTAKNAACQKAALIYQANTGKFFTEPAYTWKCYVPGAVDAALLSARVFGQTTVFAVTSIMADQGEENTFTGNRRWLLYPPAKSMGHGSTNKVSLIWTLDNSGNKDSSEYQYDFVSWPPRDYCPLMFAFPRWSFSLHADLSKAKVSMSAGGKPLELVQEKQVSGYGMPSVVWTPGFKPIAGTTYTVTITNIYLHGERTPSTYTYTVEFLDIYVN